MCAVSFLSSCCQLDWFHWLLPASHRRAFSWQQCLVSGSGLGWILLNCCSRGEMARAHPQRLRCKKVTVPDLSGTGHQQTGSETAWGAGWTRGVAASTEFWNKTSQGIAVLRARIACVGLRCCLQVFGTGPEVQVVCAQRENASAAGWLWDAIVLRLRPFPLWAELTLVGKALGMGPHGDKRASSGFSPSLSSRVPTGAGGWQARQWGGLRGSAILGRNWSWAEGAGVATWLGSPAAVRGGRGGDGHALQAAFCALCQAFALGLARVLPASDPSKC